MKKTKKPKKDSPKSFNIFWCDTCKTNKEMSHAEMRRHIQKVHGLDPKTSKCNARMVLHLDGRDYFQSKYEITFQTSSGPVNLTREICCEREPDDPFRFA